jgi:glutathionylspermidine synthase
MRRLQLTPRADWQAKVEQQGLIFHTEEDRPYWFESACYEFTESETDALEIATNELHKMCIQAVEHVITNRRYAEFGIPPHAIPAIEITWEADPPSLYGRFDLVYDGNWPPKMLEYNADTPTSLLEAAVIQWKWLEEISPSSDQFNSIWEGLVDEWTWLKENKKLNGVLVHFGHCGTVEDEMTVAVLRDTAQEAGIPGKALLMEELGFDERRCRFIDLENIDIHTIFKLYPWEWMMNEGYAQQCLQTLGKTQWIEPIWKMILSNKALLAILWELFPSSPYLVPAYLDSPRSLNQWVKKPILGREGANVTINGLESSGGEYGNGGFVYQEYIPITPFDGAHPVLGSWVIGTESRGIGIRETDNLITDNLARFVPHRISA